MAISVEHENIQKNVILRVGIDFYTDKEALKLCECNVIGDTSEVQPQWLSG